MAINCYTGLMGSGKSYEVVSEVIVPAIAAGRRVVTNVEGINEELIHEYIEKKYEGKHAENLGSVVHVQNDEVHKPNFFFHGQKSQEEDPFALKTVTQAGDLVVIDEAWRFFGNGQALHENVMIFLREHRHFVHAETKTACDLVLMTQDVGDLCKQVKHVLEMTTRTVKLKALGLHKNYRVEIYEGYRIAKGSFIQQQIKKYNKEIFPLYQSYKGGSGKEVVLDDRQNIFKKPSTWAMLAAPLILMPLGGWLLYDMSQNLGKDSKKAQAKAEQTLQKPALRADGKPALPMLPAAAGGDPSKLPALPAGIGGAEMQSLSRAAKPIEESADKRITGTLRINGKEVLLLAMPNKTIVLDQPNHWLENGRLTTNYKREIVSVDSGQGAAQGGMTGAANIFGGKK